MTKKDKKILTDFQDLIRRNGWITFNSSDGTEWFGGRSHNYLSSCIPAGGGNLEDYDFLVVGYKHCLDVF
jgi:hypothetical protein